MAILVPVTEEEKKSPLYPYLERPLTPADPALYEKVAAGPMDPKDALSAADMNRLFEPGYLSGECGYCRMPDGSTTMANLTKLPGVTIEMLDWWFAWHGVQPIRYKVWDPEDHFYCQTRHVEQACDESLSFKERYWNTIHDVKESLVAGTPPMDIEIKFRNPADVGFDKEKLAEFDGTIIVSGGEGEPGIMCHFARPTEDGIELRTRFWLGWGFLDGKPQLLLPPGAEPPLEMLPALQMHNIKEYTNLAAILPGLYAEYKDRFAPF